MTELGNRRRARRIGVMLCAFAILIATLGVDLGGVLMPVGALWIPLLVAVPLAAVGLGLVVGSRVASVGGVVLFGLLALMSAIDLVSHAVESASAQDWGVAEALWRANALASALLLGWLELRAIQVLLDRPGRGGQGTARIAGGALAVIAVSHLALAADIPGSWSGASAGWAVHFSSRGSQLIGFPGWPIWHVALLATACGLLFGRGRQLRLAATGLVLLLVLVVPLGAIAAARSTSSFPFDLSMGLLVIGMTATLVYLAWWLRDEVGRAPA